MIKIKLQKNVWEYNPKRLLGPEGGFGAVYYGNDSNGNPVAVKCLKITAPAAGHRELKISDGF